MENKEKKDFVIMDGRLIQFVHLSQIQMDHETTETKRISVFDLFNELTPLKKMETLYSAVEFGNQDFLEYLYKEGFDFEEFTDMDGDSILHYAAMKDQVDILRYFVLRGLNVNVINSSGATPLEYAYFYHSNDCIEYLRMHGGLTNIVSVFDSVRMSKMIQEEDKPIIINVLKMKETLDEWIKKTLFYLLTLDDLNSAHRKVVEIQNKEEQMKYLSISFQLGLDATHYKEEIEEYHIDETNVIPILEKYALHSSLKYIHYIHKFKVIDTLNQLCSDLQNQIDHFKYKQKLIDKDIKQIVRMIDHLEIDVLKRD